MLLILKEYIINSHTLSRLQGTGKQTKVNLDIQGLVNQSPHSYSNSYPVSHLKQVIGLKQRVQVKYTSPLTERRRNTPKQRSRIQTGSKTPLHAR